VNNGILMFERADTCPWTFLHKAALHFRGVLFIVHIDKDAWTCDLIPDTEGVAPMIAVPWQDICQYLFAVAIAKSREESLPTMQHPVAGQVLMFASKFQGSAMIPSVIRKRIHLLSLQDRDEIQFVPNTNITSTSCVGMLVAFCLGTCLDTDTSKLLQSEWCLGILLVHNINCTIIQEALPIRHSVSTLSFCIYSPFS